MIFAVLAFLSFICILFGLVILSLEEKGRAKTVLSFFLIMLAFFFSFNLREMDNWCKSEDMAEFINSKSKNHYSVEEVYYYFYMDDSNKDLKVKFIKTYEGMLEDKKKRDYIGDTVEELAR